MPDRVNLSVDGAIHAGWTSVSINRSMENIAGTFSLSLSDRWPGSAGSRPIRPGSLCTLSIGDDVVITGHVDDVSPSFDSTSHSISITGRDATGDLVDCSAANEPGEWTERSLLQIIEALCKPFGITARAAIYVGKKILTFRINEGETAFEAIELACRMRGVLSVSDGQGGLILTRASEAVRITNNLTSGKAGNIISGSGKSSWKDRYSEITVKGQQRGTDNTSGADNAEPYASTTDPNITRYRPLIVLAEDQGDAATFKERALWEASVRRARGRTATVTVQGWRGEDGSLWQPMSITNIEAPEIGLNGEMLITAVDFTLSARGSLTSLSLSPPKAFELIAVPQDFEEEWANETSN